MSTVKILCTAAIMIACFAVIYPRFMHPLVLRVFGLNDSPKTNSHGGDSFPPGHKGRVPPSGRKDDIMAEEMKRNLRQGPHPGMRHAAEMNARQQGSQGSGRGMMGVVLPMYAVGIVLYLIYTLYKVFNKTKGQTAWSPQSQQRVARKPAAPTHDSMGFPTEFDNSSNDNVQDFLHDQQQRKDLEDLLTRADDKNVSVEEMRMLQKRLEETEAQMTKILAAMQGVQRAVPDPNNLADEIPPAETPPSKSQTKSDSPDDKGYEVVDKSEEGTDGEKDGKTAEVKQDVDLDGIDSEEETESENEAEEETKSEAEEKNEGEVVEEDERSEVMPERKEEVVVRLRNVKKAED